MKKSFLKRLPIILAVGTVIYSCEKKIIVNTSTDTDKKVYVAGWKQVGTQKAPALWVDGVAQSISFNSSTGDALSIFVSDEGKVYITGVVGSYEYGNARGILWADGEVQLLPYGAYPSDIYVDGTDIYIVGEGAGNKAFLWKNGNIELLTPSGNTDCAGAYSIVVKNGDVYIGGTAANNYQSSTNSEDFRAVVWKNGVPQYLTDGNNMSANVQALYIDGEDIYAVGNVTGSGANNYGSACIWVNGTKQILSAQCTSACDITLLNGKVYVVGYEAVLSGSRTQAYIPIVWVDGERQNLENEYLYTYAYSVAVWGDDIYIVGEQIDDIWNWEESPKRVMLWKNGELVDLPFSAENSGANTLFIR